MDFKLITYHPKAADIGFFRSFSIEEAKKAQSYHASFPMYQTTPLCDLSSLARSLGVQSIQIKDESKRFGLNAFKVLGGSYALGCYIAEKLNCDISELPAEKILSEEVRKQLGELCFVTATDGNHGRGVAWTATQLGQKSVVYMPKGSAAERLENIRSAGADASITDLNYDDTVRFAAKQAKEQGWVLVQDTTQEGYVDIPLHIMQGYTTMGYELIQQLNEPPTHLFLQAGVGSMAAAVAAFFRSYYGEGCPHIIIVEPHAANCFYRTAEANDGTLHSVGGDMNTIMAGLACGEPCSLAWDLLEHCAAAFISCPDYAAADGMRALAAPLGDDPALISGESGASAFGCALNILRDPELSALKEQLKIGENSRLLFISTEGDTDKENYRRIVMEGAYYKT